MPPVGDLPALAASADVGMLALYHLVPAPRNFLMEQIFARDLPDDAVLTTEGMGVRVAARHGRDPRPTRREPSIHGSSMR